MHTGLQLITGTETRQQAYVGISRGTHANIALVFTSPPASADPRPGPRSAPELARAKLVAADRAGDIPERAADARDEALSALAGVLGRDGAQMSALETREQSYSAADHLAALHAQWQAATSAAGTECWSPLMTRTLPEAYRGELSHQSKWLWRTLRAAELSGLDPDEVLTTAITERDLTGTRDVAAVIDARIRHRTAGLIPLPQPPWTQRIPEQARPSHRQYLTGLADAMDDRTRRIVEHTAQHQPGWAIRALGPVPADPHDREAWQYNAAVIGAYRELSGYSHPADPVGPEPVRGDPDLRAAWHDAFGRLGPVDGADVRGLPDGTLHLLRDQYQAATRWAPRYVTDALRHVRLGVGDADLQAIRRDALARAAADHGQRDSAQTNQRLAASYRAMASSYRSREMILAATDKDRREWEAITISHDDSPSPPTPNYAADALDTPSSRSAPPNPRPSPQPISPGWTSPPASRPNATAPGSPTSLRSTRPSPRPSSPLWQNPRHHHRPAWVRIARPSPVVA